MLAHAHPTAPAGRTVPGSGAVLHVHFDTSPPRRMLPQSVKDRQGRFPGPHQALHGAADLSL